MKFSIKKIELANDYFAPTIYKNEHLKRDKNETQKL